VGRVALRPVESTHDRRSRPAHSRMKVSRGRRRAGRVAMLLDLSRLRGGVEHVERQYEASVLARVDDEFRVSSAVDLVADVQKDAQKVRLSGRVRATLALECSRCLEPYQVPIDAPFDMLMLPLSADAHEAEREVGQEDLGVSFYKDDVLDLGEVMREQIYLALPMKPLCRQDCRGLCPVCGKNRNHEACSCQAEWIDPRMEPLKRFMK
jgi:uncharacterized protein